MSSSGPVLVELRLGAPRRLSVAADGAQASHESRGARWGADGSVLFESLAPQLAASDHNSTWDVFRLAGTGGPVALSRDPLGQTGGGVSLAGALSPDGRLALFDSSAANLVAFDLNGARDVFVRDLATGAVRLVSSNSGGAAGNGDSFAARFTPDGRGVLFESLASDLVAGDTNLTRDLFLKELDTGAIRRVSVGPAGEEARGQSGGGSLSADGRWLLFESNAPNLVAGDSNGAYDVFLKDLTTGFVRRLSVAADGSELNGHSLRARFTADEAAVVFETLASNLVPGDRNGARDIVRVELAGGQVTRLSVGDAGQEANGSSLAASLGGGWVAFETNATNLGRGDSNARRDIWLRDAATGAMLRVLGAGGVEPDGDSLNPQLSADGQRLLFESFASNLVAGDTNGVRDIFEVALERAVVSLAGSASGPPLTGLLLFDDADPLAVHALALDAAESALGSFAATLEAPARGDAVGAVRWSFTPGAGALALRGGEERVLVATLAVIGPTGARAEQALSVTLAGVEDPPVAQADALRLGGGEARADLWPLLLANDADPDAGDALAIARVEAPAIGTLSFDPAAQRLGFAADGALAELPSGAAVAVPFAYWVADTTGREARAGVEIRVTGTRAKAVAGSGGADVLAGTIGPDWLAGLAGDDRAEGGAGADRLDGGAGADRLEGGLGDDVFVIDHAGDILVERPGEGQDMVEALVAATLPAEVEELRLMGDGLAGTGNALANQLFGTAGPDRLDGGAGADRLDGGAGNDMHVVDSPGDLVVERAGGGWDTVETGLAAYTLPDHVEALRLTGAGAAEGRGNALGNHLAGGAGADRLLGLGGDDLLDGGAGDDRLDGGPGADRLRGGAGADQFVLRRGEAAGDWILDFDGQGVGPGDTLLLAGWGPGTQLVEGPGPQEWTLIDGLDGWRETLRIVGAVHPSDLLFG
jgi:Tol biopolymer transport system component